MVSRRPGVPKESWRSGLELPRVSDSSVIPPTPPTDSVSGAASGALQLVRLPVEKPQVAVDFLHARSEGVMDLIAHFWERLSQTPPLQRPDLHLVAALPAHGIALS